MNKDTFGGWLVRIRSGGANTISCCGSYISPLLVLTSANCITPFRYQLEGTNVMATAYTEDEEYSYSLVETIYTPDYFKPQTTNLDIAVVRLNIPIKGKMVEFIQLASRMPRFGQTLTTFGWGFNSLEVQPATDEPRQAKVQNMNRIECRDMFKETFVSKTVMCVKMFQDRLKCLYDGGSPLVFNNQLVGIASVGSTCANTSVPGIYTAIPILRSYIEKIQMGVRTKTLSRRKRNALSKTSEYV
ncbi:GH18182 [Drosophila grimshawi]|uniref:trypsin n=1 Tax=Drosophila grimshawi TaxID=7222 RepID=B4JG45_DROGR|nr:GH18182 [Drosophila grimshawi]